MKWIERISLIALALFSAFAIGGYWFFGLHPENLARFPESAQFYAKSYSFFSQTQVWLSGIVLAILLSSKGSFKWVTGFVAVYFLSLGSELLGTTTGFPFGDYEYSSLLGTKWFDHVPYLIPSSWFTMALPSFVLVERALSHRVPMVWRWAIAAALLTSWDLVLDPAMSFLVPYWLWGQAGSFYGMPWINLAGWFVTGFVLSAALNQFNAVEATKHVSSKTLLIYYAIVYAMPAGMLIAAGEVLLVVLVTAGIGGAIFWGYTIGKTAPVQESEDDSPDAGDRHELSSRLTEIADRTGEYFEKHSRSFSFASFLFAPADRLRVARLYAFCRMSDDIADEPGLTEEQRETLIGEWTSLVRSAYDGTVTGVTWLDDLMTDLRQKELRFNVIEGLLDAVKSDIRYKPLRTQQDLADYSFGVASTVGIMMCHMFDETEPWKQERAISLGLAMQLTNIYRDVGEDLTLDRVYLPQEWLTRYELTESDLRDMRRTGVLTSNYRQMMADLEGYANLAYRKAWEAIPELSWRFGPSVAVAANVYRGIHAAIRRNGNDNLRQRAYVSTARKVGLAFTALARYSGEKSILAIQRWSPRVIRERIQSIIDKARMTWMVPILVLLLQAAILMGN